MATSAGPIIDAGLEAEGKGLVAAANDIGTSEFQFGYLDGGAA
jgi:hypothetical protein